MDKFCKKCHTLTLSIELLPVSAATSNLREINPSYCANCGRPFVEVIHFCQSCRNYTAHSKVMADNSIKILKQGHCELRNVHKSNRSAACRSYVSKKKVK